MDRLVEKLVADEHHQREETQLKMAENRDVQDDSARGNDIKLNDSKLRLDFVTYYSFVGVLASLALMMKSGKRMENKQPLKEKIKTLKCNAVLDYSL